ncbi:hypothetical protein V2J09_007694 [Rumex salicifolius]
MRFRVQRSLELSDPEQILLLFHGSSNTGGWRKSNSRTSLSADASRESLFGTAGRWLRDESRQAPSDHNTLRRRTLASSGTNEGEIATIDPFVCSREWGDASLRQWLDNPRRLVDAIECLHIFRQIVEVVSSAHSQGVVVNNVRPSCFVMSSFNRVSFIESASCSDSGSDSLEDESNNKSRQPKEIGRLVEEGQQLDVSTENASQLISIGSCLQSSLNQGCVPFNEGTEESKQPFPMKRLLLMETSWYTSPEEIAGAPSSCASDIYRLGVLLFELYCTFSSAEEKSSTMSSLRHRVLPPHLLLKWPKEASFCLWLLHPDPSSRPKMGELLQSCFLNEPRDDIEERQAAIELREKIEENELLIEFLTLMRHTKLEAATKLQNVISLVSSDIEEVVSKQRSLRKKGGFSSELDDEAHLSASYLPLLHVSEPEEETSMGSRKRNRPGLNIQDLDSHTSDNSRLMKNFNKLESAYLLTRRRPSKPSGKLLTGQSPVSSNSRGSGVLTERSASNSCLKGADEESGWISPFLEGLCKYLSFTNLRVKADLKQGDLLNSSNLICSVSFDRDGEFFAAAGVNKKIKIFECDAILNEEHDMHYPVVELASNSKLSSVCWNGYIKSQIASSNFEGVVQVWDVTRNQVFMELKEHQKRVWSIDFSLADPTILASGSDDGSVKLWSINQAILFLHLVDGTSIGTIKTKANVCCVQFPSDSGRTLAFGSADHKVYYYDLRNPRVPLCTLIGHNKTVSYVKFVDSTNLVSSSTDNTLKIWDLSTCTSRVLDSPIHSFTGHTNVKNFVGLSVSDGYIATGSETNEVFIYHKAFPMPTLSFKLNSMNSLSGHDLEDTAQFISSVCWRGQSSTLVAANSTGDIKILEMV